MPIHKLTAVWKTGAPRSSGGGPVHVSMNDYLIHRLRDIPRVVREGMISRRHRPRTPGALGLWFAAFKGGRRQVSISVWRGPEDLRALVRSPAHQRIMREYRNVGALYTNTWAAERLDRQLIWHQAADRLAGRIEDVPHH